MAKKIIGVTLLTESHQFYKELADGIKSEAEKVGYDVKIVSGEFDEAKQEGQIAAFIADKVDAIVVSPCNSSTIGDAIVKANEAGIPVFTADISNNSGKGEVITHITSDNEQGGKLAARLISRAVGYQGKVGIIDHPGITSVEERIKGFKDMMSKFPGIKIDFTVSSMGQRDKAYEEMKKVLKDSPDINGVFAINDASAMGALNAIEEEGKVGKIFIVGYDAEPVVRKEIGQGRIYADVRQHPIKIGQEMIKCIEEHFRELKLPPIVFVEVGTWT